MKVKFPRHRTGTADLVLWQDMVIDSLERRKSLGLLNDIH